MKVKCRSCETEFSREPLLTYQNMPKSAQLFPDEKEVATEKGVDVLIHQCPYCGLLQIAGEPVPYYREVIRAVGVSAEMKEFRRNQYTAFLEKNHLAGRKILEVGAGSGEYMEMMAAAGGNVTGLEYGSASVAQGKQKGLHMQQGFLEKEETRVAGGPYDGFYVMNFLEHIPQPNQFLKAIFHNLTEDGVGLVEVPNVDMILEKKLFSEFISDHLMYFTEDTLRQLLEQNGFLVLECKPIWHNYILSAQVRKRKILDVSGFVKQKDSIKVQLQEMLEERKAQGKNVAVWGAGHQALATLALAEVEKFITCVIDSAPFKQGHYTPATHLPVVSPERLLQKDIQTVIIMAASYTKEIQSILQTQYPWVEAVVLEEEEL